MATVTAARAGLKAYIETNSPKFVERVTAATDKILAGEIMPFISLKTINEINNESTKLAEAFWYIRSLGFDCEGSNNNIVITVSPV